MKNKNKHKHKHKFVPIQLEGSIIPDKKDLMYGYTKLELILACTCGAVKYKKAYEY